MCKAIDYANSINDRINEAKDYYNKLKIKEKIFEDIQQDLLHKIEDLDEIDLHTGWEITQSLQKLRKARRENKNELKTMEMLISRNFKVNEYRIKNHTNFVSKLNYENNYHRRQLKMTDDILREVDSIVNNVLSNEDITRSNANKFNKTKKELNNIENVYDISDNPTLPKEKGSTVNVIYYTEKQKQHLINKISLGYESFKINEKEGFITLVNRIK